MTDENSAETFAWRVEHEAALRAHSSDGEWQKYMHQSAMTFAVEAVKAICLITGGSVVVGLAFIGSIYGSEPNLAKALVTPIFMLAASAVAATLCAAMSYVAQYCYANATFSKVYVWTHPYIQHRPELKRYNFGGLFHIIAMLAAFAAFVFMIWGGYIGWQVLAA